MLPDAVHHPEGLQIDIIPKFSQYSFPMSQLFVEEIVAKFILISSTLTFSLLVRL